MKINTEIQNFLDNKVISYGNALDDSNLVRFDLTESPYGFTPKISKMLALDNDLIEMLRKYPDPNPSGLFTVISEVFGVKTNNISIGNGVSDLIDRISQIFLEKGSKVLVHVPTFFRFIESAKKVGASVTQVDCKIEDDFEFNSNFRNRWLSEIRNSQPNLIWICNPNNPTGLIFPKDLIKETLEITEGVVVIDEVNNELLLDNTNSSKSLIEKHDNLIVLNSLSKVYALAGIRFGFAISSEKITSILESIRPRHHVATIVRKIAEIAIGDQNNVRKNATLITKDSKNFMEKVRTLDKIHICSNSKTNNILLQKKDLHSSLLFKGFLTVNLTGYNGIVTDDIVRVSLQNEESNTKLFKVLSEINNENITR